MTTPQMDWLDDQRRKRAVSSDDIVRRMELMDVPPGSYDEETLYDAVAEIKRLRAEIERLRAAGDALAATWPEEDRCGCNNKDCRAVVAAYDAWQEARRG